jgi:putative heme iron utilization protein
MALRSGALAKSACKFLTICNVKGTMVLNRSAFKPVWAPEKTDMRSQSRMMSADNLPHEVREFQSTFRSALMATANQDGAPEASYAPYVTDARGSHYMFVSGLARHTRDFHETGQVSLQFIENECATRNLFARRRLTLLCDLSVIPHTSPVHKEILEQFAQRFGRFVNTLRSLPDFQLFRLTPRGGLYVRGFGQTFRV